MLILNWGELPVGIAEHHQGVTRESHIEEGAPHAEWDHAAFIDYDGIFVLLLFSQTDEVGGGLCKLDNRHR